MRLIDADILLEKMKHRRDYVGRPSDPVCLIEDAPIVEAKPIIYAYWQDVSPYDKHYGRCSNCHSSPYWKTSYCPECGAKMRNKLEN